MTSKPSVSRRSCVSGEFVKRGSKRIKERFGLNTTKFFGCPYSPTKPYAPFASNRHSVAQGKCP